MAYKPTIWVDTVTPVNANNMNKAETGIKQQEMDISVLSEYVINVEDKLSNDVRIISDFVGDLSSDDLSYTTEADTSILTVRDALDKLLYVPLSANFSANKGNVEKGGAVSSVAFNWSYNKNVTSQKFNNEILDNSIRSKLYTTPFNTNKSFSLNASDGKTTVNRSVSINFLNGRYWGVSSEPSDYNSSFISSLSKELVESKSKTFTVNCEQNQFIYFCLPKRLGTPSFSVGGFDGGFSIVKSIEFTNPSGYTESYDIWKSTNSNLGNTTIVVR